MSNPRESSNRNDEPCNAFTFYELLDSTTFNHDVDCNHAAFSFEDFDFSNVTQNPLKLTSHMSNPRESSNRNPEPRDGTPYSVTDKHGTITMHYLSIMDGPSPAELKMRSSIKTIQTRKKSSKKPTRLVEIPKINPDDDQLIIAIKLIYYNRNPTLGLLERRFKIGRTKAKDIFQKLFDKGILTRDPNTEWKASIGPFSLESALKLIQE